MRQEPTTTGVAGLNGAVERLGRRLAARTTRRSFLDRMAKVAVLVAGGPALATLLADRAEARVCGQSGVAAKCPTFDCVGPGDVWGWCWYASPGCCSNGGLKKICDCCRVDYPNVHGYCPSGTNVLCILESCLADPRVMAKPTLRAAGMSAAAVAVARSGLAAAGRGGAVVIGDAHDHLAASVAGPVAAAVHGPLLLSDRDRVPSPVADEIQRLGAVEAFVVGPAMTPAVDAALTSMGLQVTRVHQADDLATASAETARWVLARVGGSRVLAVAATGPSATAAPAAAAVAGAGRAALVVGFDEAVSLTTGPDAPATVTYLVGPGMAERAPEVAGAFAVHGADHVALGLALADLAARDERRINLSVNLVPAGSTEVAAGLAGSRGVLLFHPDGVLGADIYRWIVAHEPSLARGVVGGSLGALGDAGIYDLQSSLNRFDTHFLQGQAGQGLPVISQPESERPVGEARAAGQPSAQPDGYWSARANPARR
ncbi:MAG TPA: hypothetical protein VMN58_05150 [Acidimicrobiales bacterium]|nr:hypothetical protein [Acidimicrobiales bacterium]